MNLRTFVPLAAALVLAAGTAAAQGTDTAMVAETPHDNSIAVELNSSPGIGVWHRFSPGVEAGLELSARRFTSSTTVGETTAQELRTTSVSVGPALKLYTGTAGPLRPYVYGSAGVSFVRVRTEGTGGSGGDQVDTQSGHGFNGALALGLEWSPVRRVTVGGHAGIQGAWGTSSQDYASGNDFENEETQVGTFTSGLRVQLYF